MKYVLFLCTSFLLCAGCSTFNSLVSEDTYKKEQVPPKTSPTKKNPTPKPIKVVPSDLTKTQLYTANKSDITFEKLAQTGDKEVDVKAITLTKTDSAVTWTLKPGTPCIAKSSSETSLVVTLKCGDEDCDITFEPKYVGDDTTGLFHVKTEKEGLRPTESGDDVLGVWVKLKDGMYFLTEAEYEDLLIGFNLDKVQKEKKHAHRMRGKRLKKKNK